MPVFVPWSGPAHACANEMVAADATVRLVAWASGAGLLLLGVVGVAATSAVWYRWRARPHPTP